MALNIVSSDVSQVWDDFISFSYIFLLFFLKNKIDFSPVFTEMIIFNKPVRLYN